MRELWSLEGSGSLDNEVLQYFEMMCGKAFCDVGRVINNKNLIDRMTNSRPEAAWRAHHRGTGLMQPATLGSARTSL